MTGDFLPLLIPMAWREKKTFDGFYVSEKSVVKLNSSSVEYKV